MTVACEKGGEELFKAPSRSRAGPVGDQWPPKAPEISHFLMTENGLGSYSYLSVLQ